MPAFVPGGPHIPDGLSDALEDGRVLFFCGAGISYPAGLPSFGDLTKAVYAKLGYTANAIDIQKSALKRRQFDTALDLLERYRPKGHIDVRRTVADILMNPKLTRRGAKATHEAILTLGRTQEGKYRVVTTNFDPIFEVVIKELELKVPIFKAPLLPVPKLSSLNGLIYLHGLLEDARNDDLLQHIVITSGDFGRAYLKERWGARFVSELLRNFTVCYVGYSIDDPVMRYMMDALAADKRMGEKSIEMYAFAGYKPGKEKNVSDEWGAKNVTPIMYPIIRGRHDSLHHTLRKWAYTYKVGQEGRTMMIHEHAGTVPLSVSRFDYAVGRVLWALSKELSAKHFAKMEQCPPLEWLEPLSEMQYFHEDLRRFGVDPPEKRDEKAKFSYIRRYTPYILAPPMALGSHWQPYSSFDGVMKWLADWLCRHLNNPDLPKWFIKWGSKLHPELATLLRQRLLKIRDLEEGGNSDALKAFIGRDQDAIPSAPMRSVLQMFIDGRARVEGQGADMYDWRFRFADLGPSAELRMELRDLLTPCVVFRDRVDIFDKRPDPRKANSVRDIVDWEISLRANNVHVALRDSVHGSDWRPILPEFLPTASSLLKDAMDIARLLGEANDRMDGSYFHQASISEHEQNRHFRDWTALVDMCRDGWRVIRPVDPGQALTYAFLWFSMPYPIFKRLAFFCAAQPDSPVPVDVAVNWLTQGDAWWLWSVETQRETIRLLVSLALRLDQAQRARLEAAILQGPPRSLYKESISEPEFQDAREHSTWLLLAKLESEAPLGNQAQSRFEELKVANPKLQLDPDQMDEFPFYMSSGYGRGRLLAAPPKIKSPKSLSELVDWLRDPPELEMLQDDDWGDRCRSDFWRASAALRTLAVEGVWPAERWRTAFQVWTDGNRAFTWTKQTLLIRSWRIIPKVLVNMPPEQFNEIAHTLGYWVHSQAKLFSRHESEFFTLCNRLLEVPEGDTSSTMEPVTESLNRADGYAVQALLSWWYRQKLEDGIGLNDKVRGIFTKIASPPNSKYRHARLFLAAHVVALFRVDETWTRANLVPLFDWSASEVNAVWAWAGFLWSPQLFLPFVSVAKPYILETAGHFSQLRDRDGDQYAHLMAFIATNPAGIFETRELADAVSKLPAEGREQLLVGVANALKGAGDKREEYWQRRVEPFIRSIWPQNIAYKSPQVAARMAQLCVEAGKEFPTALELLGGWLEPVDYAYSLLHDLLDEGLCTLFPEEALEFVSKVVAEDIRYLPSEFGKCLEQILAAKPTLASDPRYVKLKELYDKRRG